MKKQLNTDLIGTELREGSAFFRDYQHGDSPAPHHVSPTPVVASEPSRIVDEQRLTQQPETPLPERPNERTPERANAKRIITRNSFEIFEDQMDSLRKLAYLEKMEGRIGSMSAMVRVAIDS